MRNALKAPMNADATPMPADGCMEWITGSVGTKPDYSSAAIGAQLSAFIGASKALRRTEC